MPASALTTAAEGAGRVLSQMTAGVAALRTHEKPLHPKGALFEATLIRTGTPRSMVTGVPWLDRSASEDVVVRISRAIGLPAPLPDVAGLAIRVPGPSMSCTDVLFASTGWNRLTRHVLVPALTKHQPMSTLLPYRTAIGPVVFGARTEPDGVFRLSWAQVGGPWRSLGALVLGEPLPDDPHLSFDPVLNVPAGLEQYAWVTRLRERAYATARASRHDTYCC